MVSRLQHLINLEDRKSLVRFPSSLPSSHNKVLNGKKLLKPASMAASASSTPLPGTLHVFWHEGMLAHDTGNGVFDTGIDPGFLDVLEKHPENSDRIKNMISILRRGPISPHITWHSGRPALLSELLSFHSQGSTSFFAMVFTTYNC